MAKQFRLVVYKGGKAMNYLLPPLQQYTKNVTYVTPISDNSGTCREIMRVFGGPSIGDTRATLTSLAYGGLQERRAIRKLLAYRLHDRGAETASNDWGQIINGVHPLWQGISRKYQGIMKNLLLRFEAERIDKARSHFDLRNGNIGDFLFTGARLTFDILESAVLMYSVLTGIPAATSVVPVVDNAKALNLAVELVSGKVVVGQDVITHPPMMVGVKVASYEPHPAPIKKVFYINNQNQVVEPMTNLSVMNALSQTNAVVYGFGSLWTSILASLVVKGSGEAIAKNKGVKVFLLNSHNDRETFGMTAIDYVDRVTDSLNRFGELSNLTEDYITHLLYVEGTDIPVDKVSLNKQGVKTIMIRKDQNQSITSDGQRYPAFDKEALVDKVIRLLAAHAEEFAYAPNPSLFTKV
jgi:2-phospho-L-lactate transferase/gluconeogenesis factor (CofD/UPF0052 family)